MKRSSSLVACVLAIVLFGAAGAAAIDTTDTRMLGQPAISAAHLAFVYAGDLWLCGVDGRNVRRITSGQGVGNPAFSPDGSLVAFTAQYEGNADVYLVPVAGGVPTRLTWHPGRDTVQGFTPDGAAIVFSSSRAVFSGRYSQLFTVPVKGGAPARLDPPYAFRGALSPDGKRIAYNPLYDAFTQWKHYRGGTHSTIWVYTTASRAVETVPQPPDRPNDVYPAWIGDTLYFVSDRAGEFNLFSYDTKSKTVAQLTRHDDFPVTYASAGGGKVAYEQAGYIHVFDPATGKHAKVTIGVTADLPDTRPRFVKGARHIRNGALSPSGARVVFESRGEIVTVPGEKGDPRNLTNTTGAHERSPAWSPDGRSIAYFSDAGGAYQLVVAPQDGKGQARTYKLPGAGFYDRPAWSPDSRKIAYTDNAWSLYWIDLETGTSKKIAAEPLYGPRKTIAAAWSPDSKWIAYTLNTLNYIQQVHVHSLDQDKSFPVTDGLSDVSEPVFDRSGKYLYMLASTDAGPVRDWFAMSNADMRATSAIYLAVLDKDTPSPLARESDEEPSDSAKKGDAKAEGAQAEGAKGEGAKDAQKPAAGKPAGDKAPIPPVVTIDVEGLANRILTVPVPAADLSSLQVGEANQIYYRRAADGKAALHRYDLGARKDETLLPDVAGFIVSADGKKLLYRSGENWSVVSTKAKIEPSQGRLNLATLEVRVDPRDEWPQIFDEAWRVNRDYFYDPTMHGVDWAAMRTKYAVFLPHVAVRDDLNRVIQWMCSELGVGHHRVGGGENRTEPASVPGGLLGADFAIENGRYRFRKVYGGLNWNPELRSPLTEPGVNVRAGEYLIAVNGRDLRAATSVYAPFENTAGKIVEITVGPNPDGSASRTVSVVPIPNEAALRNRDWVEGNVRRVTEATKGRVAYVYVPNTSTMGHTYFKRYFYPQANRDAIIVDERFNGGGSVADYYTDLLRRPHGAYWATRYGADFATPTASIRGPKVLLIDETAGSGGDLFPWMWRKFEMGPIVGKRTWGGLVGTLGFPVLMDGGMVTAPNLAIWTEDGWVVENEGVPPDIEVEQNPADLLDGKDPQLERAIQVAMEELKKNPPAKPKRPPYRNVPKERGR
ncbi:MAG TPA: PDZ domain-containing protein [Vicinamibacterales bacterium]|nr:PDZ domain-containing protein [Vicinamibacterales bacterium]